MSTYSGLSASNAALARTIFAQAADVCMRNKDSLHYTKDARRWQGIDSRVVAVEHYRAPRQYGKPGVLGARRTGRTLSYGDCSSTGTWMLWLALYKPFRLGDIVNGAGWKEGYTGTLLSHGRRVSSVSDLKVGDAVIYGDGSESDHVTWAIGGGRLFSHGSEPGPFVVSTSYRGSEIMGIRRYI